MKITEIESIGAANESVLCVVIDYENGQFRTVPKSKWEEEQAQAELGGTL